MGVTTVVPFGRAQLRKDKIGAGEEDRVGSQRVSGADEDGTKGCSQDGSPQVMKCGSQSSPIYTAICQRSKLCSPTSKGAV